MTHISSVLVLKSKINDVCWKIKSPIPKLLEQGISYQGQTAMTYILEHNPAPILKLSKVVCTDWSGFR